MRIAFQIDQIREITINNCTLAMMEEAQARGYELFHFTPEALTLHDNKLYTRANKLRVDLSAAEFITLGEENYIPLSFFDIVFIRQEPVSNMRFIANTYLLEKAVNDTWIINHPAAIRNAAEKLEYFGFEHHRPPTLITLDRKAIENFRAEHGEIVIKPLCYYGGRGVFHISQDDKNVKAIVDSLYELTKLPLVVQKFLPEVISEGDTRVLLLFGKVAGAYIRKPAANEIRANFFSGGSIHKIELSARKMELAQHLAKELHERGIDIAGIDLIGDYLTEINVITPAGFLPLRKVYGHKPEQQMWDDIETQIKQRKHGKS